MAVKKVLFLTLKTFGFTGGIEKVCRIICRALYDIGEENFINPMVYSMYDYGFHRDSRYLKKQQFQGFKENRQHFVIKSFFKGVRSDVVILSHVNLLFIAYLIKSFRPKTKIYLIAHGIEIWRKLPSTKISTLNKLDKIIAVSHFTASKISELHGVNPNKIEVLNNCLDPFYYFPSNFSKPDTLLKRYGLNNEHTILLSLCRLSSTERYKGYDNTIAIIPKLVEKNPKLIYLIAGKPDEIEKQRIEDLIANFRIEKHIKLIGFVDEAEMSDYFLLSDIFALPSKKEGFGIVFIEAMASGLSAVAGNKDGSVDALKNGELGELIDPDNLTEIEQTLSKLLENPLSHKERLNLQERVIDAFSYEKYRDKLRNLVLYNSINYTF